MEVTTRRSIFGKVAAVSAALLAGLSKIKAVPSLDAHDRAIVREILESEPKGKTYWCCEVHNPDLFMAQFCKPRMIAESCAPEGRPNVVIVHAAIWRKDSRTWLLMYGTVI